MWIITIQSSGYNHQMAGQVTTKSLPPTSGYNKRKVSFTETQGSSSSSAHNFRKFRTRAGGPKMATTSTTRIWRPRIAASWEMRYCEEEGSIPWRRIVQRRKLKESCDEKIKKTWDWDASSAEEALEKAKARYWCKLNGFPYESLTNEESADMYNDTNIDWNPEIDPEMSMALDRRYENDVIINEGGNNWLTKHYLENKDKEVIEGWGSDHNVENEYKNN
ncbi:hypothetical protein MKW92_025655 [Papaver armeniacum]|nr:hypothetical protein MKW92_025655 [Papaver armeniacum]